MSYELIISDLKKKIYKPVYLLYGEESYFIDEICNYIAKNVLDEGEKSFNQTVLYGKDIDVHEVIFLCRKFPMMANQQVVILKEAQDIKKVEDFDTYLKNPVKSTILVIAFKNTRSIDKRKKFFQYAKANGVILESKKLYERGIFTWINQYLNKYDLTIHPEALRLLYESIGADLSRLSNNIEKLRITMPKDKKQIDIADISQNIGLHRDFNVFELQKALGIKDGAKAFKIIDHFSKDTKSNPIVYVISQVFEYYLKILKYHLIKGKSKKDIAAGLGVHPYFVDEYARAANNYNMRKIFMVISYIRECDVKSKGVNAASISQGDLLKELVFKILY